MGKIAQAMCAADPTSFRCYFPGHSEERAHLYTVWCPECIATSDKIGHEAFLMQYNTARAKLVLKEIIESGLPPLASVVRQGTEHLPPRHRKWILCPVESTGVTNREQVQIFGGSMACTGREADSVKPAKGQVILDTECDDHRIALRMFLQMQFKVQQS